VTPRRTHGGKTLYIVTTYGFALDTGGGRGIYSRRKAKGKSECAPRSNLCSRARKLAYRDGRAGALAPASSGSPIPAARSGWAARAEAPARAYFRNHRGRVERRTTIVVQEMAGRRRTRGEGRDWVGTRRHLRIRRRPRARSRSLAPALGATLDAVWAGWTTAYAVALKAFSLIIQGRRLRASCPRFSPTMQAPALRRLPWPKWMRIASDRRGERDSGALVGADRIARRPARHRRARPRRRAGRGLLPARACRCMQSSPRVVSGR